MEMSSGKSTIEITLAEVQCEKSGSQHYFYVLSMMSADQCRSEEACNLKWL